jgi:hypothetical protein
MPDVWRRCGSTYLNGKDTPSQVGDEIIGQWSEQQLMRMNAQSGSSARSRTARSGPLSQTLGRLHQLAALRQRVSLMCAWASHRESVAERAKPSRPRGRIRTPEAPFFGFTPPWLD